MSQSVKVLGPFPVYLLRGRRQGQFTLHPPPEKADRRMSEYKTQNPEKNLGEKAI